MSRLFYFASDMELSEQPNPYLNYLSVNEALSLGLEINKDLLNEDISYDEPGVITYCEDEKNFSYPVFYQLDPKDLFDYIGTSKEHCVALQWEYSDDTVNVVLDYIKKQLEKVPYIEMWSVWLGNVPEDVNTVSTMSELSVDELTVSMLRDFYTSHNDYRCLVITR